MDERVMNKRTYGSAASVLSLLIIALLLIPFSAAFAVSPAAKTVDFTPNKTVTIDFDVINSEGAELELGVGVSGELASYIFIDKPSLSFNSSELRKSFKVMISMPSELEPGFRQAIIRISPESSYSGDMFSVRISPEIPIRVRVPFPSLYVVPSLAVLQVDEGTSVPVFIEFDNLGSEDAIDAGGLIKAYSLDGGLLAEARTNRQTILKNSFAKTRAMLPPMRKGAYRLGAEAEYAGIRKLLEMNFSLGKPILRARELSSRELVAGEINKLSFMVVSDWNLPFDVKGIVLLDEGRNELADFRIGAGEDREILAFIDAQEALPGKHNLTITLRYSDQLKSYHFEVSVVKKKASLLSVMPLLTNRLVLASIALIIILIIATGLVLKPKKKK
ncbi:MAG: hypothetical protein V1866_03680 [archaeon]